MSEPVPSSGVIARVPSLVVLPAAESKGLLAEHLHPRAFTEGPRVSWLSEELSGDPVPSPGFGHKWKKLARP